MGEFLLWGTLLPIFAYWAVPGIITRIFGIGIFRKSEGGREIALTFDDGPDPSFTPLLLDLLQKYGVKATFFVLGSQAKTYPELIARMHEEGHLIGMHNYVHRTNWLMFPWTVKRQLQETAAIIEDITGKKPAFYRPPWGLLNLFDFRLRKQYQLILWSVMAGDWSCKGGSERIRRQLLKKMKSGSVICLHDSDKAFGADANSPTYMLEALEDVLKEIYFRNYICKRIDEMTGMKYRS
ncbi:polysaccharide deacetylase family protein [Aneurinibacillus sp. Ricciae_BoGa-3]|uniref:polysaccharide deacetylase family protein n=1 Tax=Aneurinibacillus sp. Ricciae_BoGa-3 TaxID=3022697 RepID=UPI002340AE2F|nr:polysaccharide deacetylase family protein [Aneurinibacillus sp. Ricciae_BoGa-3]WCK54057.1 polysaccharide deacetylase family protein [Aneurinibacillus sp. Ricciae_BoGa-3]